MQFLDFEESELKKIAQQINLELNKRSSFVLWLEAEMGMGKTTLVKHILQDRGWPKNLPVQSPTFTYVQEYEIGGNKYAHIDLYRLDGNKSGLNALGLEDIETFHGSFIEWPNILDGIDLLKPTHRLTIEFGSKPNLRVIRFAALL